MNKFTLLIVALMCMMCLTYVQAIEQNATTTTTTSTPSLKVEGKKLLNNGLFTSRGVSANCQYDINVPDVKIFRCTIGFSKKIFTQTVQGMAEVAVAINLKDQTATVTISTNSHDEFFKKTIKLSDLSGPIPPICADVLPQIGLCLKLSTVKIHSTNPQCFKLDLEAYIQALSYREVVLTQPIGYNANLC